MTLMQTTVAVAASLIAALPANAGERLAFVERAETDAVTHVAGPHDSVGDLLTFADPIYDAANKVQLGTDQGYCVRVVVGKSWECIWTLNLLGGQITIEGPYMDQGDSTFAVTGGTGRYVGAKGTLRVHPRDAQGSSYDLVYELF
jgi:allene oxide cyclase